MPPQEQPAQPLPHRLLALDPGERRIGVALSDATGLLAHPRPAIPGADLAAACERVAAIVADEGVSEVFVGLPLTLEGRAAFQAGQAKPLVAALKARLRVPVREWDERLSSASAGRALTGKRDRKSGEIDSAAAAILLQAVLDSRRTVQR